MFETIILFIGLKTNPSSPLNDLVNAAIPDCVVCIERKLFRHFFRNFCFLSDLNQKKYQRYFLNNYDNIVIGKIEETT